jgi:hypothetical protein
LFLCTLSGLIQEACAYHVLVLESGTGTNRNLIQTQHAAVLVVPFAFDSLDELLTMLPDSRHATVDAMIDETVSRGQPILGLELRLRIKLFFHDILAVVVSLYD